MFAGLSALAIKWLLSTGMGLIGGGVSQWFQSRQDAADKAHELAMLEAQGKLAVIDRQTQLDQLREQAGIEQTKADSGDAIALAESWKPLGISWVDALNGLMRPVAGFSAIIVFDGFALLYMGDVGHQLLAGTLAPGAAVAAFTESIFAEMVIAVWGFLFGYRAFRSARTS